MRQGTRPPCFKMTSCFFGTKSLPDTILAFSNCILGNKFQRNLNHNATIFIQGNGCGLQNGRCFCFGLNIHYGVVIMDTMTSQITSLTLVYSSVYTGADQRNHQSSASLAFVQGIHRLSRQQIDIAKLRKFTILCNIIVIMILHTYSN